MLIEHTKSKLHQLKLHGMVQTFDGQLSSSTAMGLGFEERFSMLVDGEMTYRDNQRMARLLKQARFREDADLADLIFRPERGLDRAMIATLETGNWVTKAHNLMITGATGSGKTWLACALGRTLCRKGLQVQFYRLGMLIEELSLARAAGTFKQRVFALSKPDLLILDDLGVADAVTPSFREHLLEVVESRAGRRSIIVTSQMPVAMWHGYLGAGNPTAADAILDRLLSSSHRIELRGDSIRKRKVDLV